MDLQHCSKCGETCNPGTGTTVDGERFHKDACPVVNHVARAAAGQRLKKARLRASGNSQTLGIGILGGLPTVQTAVWGLRPRLGQFVLDTRKRVTD